MPFVPSFEDATRRTTEKLQKLDYDRLFGKGALSDPLAYNILATYPPLAAMAEMTPDEIYGPISGPARVYVHLPFCEQYCTFCHYTKEINPQNARVERYLRALLSEIELCAQRIGPDAEIKSYFFGGGTPSYLSAGQLDRLLTKLKDKLPLDEDGEIYFELHPGVSRRSDYGERMDVLVRHGVERIVFGVQSMEDRILAKLNRGHDRQDVFNMIATLQSRGLKDFSIDLILGLPYQTREVLYRTLEDLLTVGASKFNVFPLIFKRTDPIYGHYMKSPEDFADSRERVFLHFLLEDILHENGFKKGPILYYSKGESSLNPLSDKTSLPTNVEGLQLIPLGVSSFGFLNHVQYFNVCNVTHYLEAVEGGRLPVWRGLRLNADERMRRAIMFALRSRGFSGEAFRRAFGVDPETSFPEVFDHLLSHGLLTIDDGHYCLSEFGQIDASGTASLFCSPSIRRKTKESLEGKGYKRNLFEKHNFSPVGHTSVVGGSTERIKA